MSKMKRWRKGRKDFLGLYKGVVLVGTWYGNADYGPFLGVKRDDGGEGGDWPDDALVSKWARQPVVRIDDHSAGGCPLFADHGPSRHEPMYLPAEDYACGECGLPAVVVIWDRGCSWPILFCKEHQKRFVEVHGGDIHKFFDACSTPGTPEYDICPSGWIDLRQFGDE
jgi:hypothetical protein